MARIRTLKPTIWESEQVAELPAEVQILFIGLITQADDEGRQKGSPQLVRSKIFPYADYSLQRIREWLRKLVEADLIHWYTVDGREFIELPTWEKHQRVSHPTKSALPSHSEADSADAPEDSGIIPERPRREGKGKEGNKETAPSTDKPPTPGRQVFDAWVEATGKNAKAVKFSKERQALLNRRLKDWPLEDLLDAVKGWRHSPHHRGENERQTVYNDLELLLRNAKNIERFRDLERESRRRKPASTPEGFVP